MIVNALLVFIGGALGTIGRWLATDVLTPVGTPSEWGLLAANLLGAGMLAFANAAISFRDAIRTHPDAADAVAAAQTRGRAMLLFGTGFCGAFTSYSALAAVIGGVGGLTDTSASGFVAAELQGLGAVSAYFAITLIGGMIAVFLGFRLGDRFARRRYGHLLKFNRRKERGQQQ